MSNIDYTLDMAANIKGAFAVAIVDYDSGMTLGSRGGSPEFDLDVAAPGNSDVVRTKLDVMQKLGLRRDDRGHPDHPRQPVPPHPPDPREQRREAVLLPGAEQGAGQPRDGPARPEDDRAAVLHGQPDAGPDARPAGRSGLLPGQRRSPLTRRRRRAVVARHRRPVNVRDDGLPPCSARS